LITAPRRTPPKGRSGPRSRRVPPPRRTFAQRNRNRLIYAALAVVVIVAGAILYVSFTQKGYTCLTEWTPGPTPTTAPSATPHIGYYQDDMGRQHVAVGTNVKYTFCPPASGYHYNVPGVSGPIIPRLYGPNEVTVPQNWIHNMEHGGLVVLYRCDSSQGDSCDSNQQAALAAFVASFPNSPICHVPKGVISPVVARFDDMKFPYVAMLWDQILPLQQWDPTQVLAFFNQNDEQTNPEQLYCAGPTASPSPTDTPAPTDTAAPTDTPAPAGSPAPTSS